MREYWANVYILDGKCDIGLERDTRQECEDSVVRMKMYKFFNKYGGPSFRIHVKLKG